MNEESPPSRQVENARDLLARLTDIETLLYDQTQRLEDLDLARRDARAAIAKLKAEKDVVQQKLKAEEDIVVGLIQDRVRSVPPGTRNVWDEFATFTEHFELPTCFALLELLPAYERKYGKEKARLVRVILAPLIDGRTYCPRSLPLVVSLAR